MTSNQIENNSNSAVTANKFPLLYLFNKITCNRNIKIKAQLRILKCIAIVKEVTQKVLKHDY